MLAILIITNSHVIQTIMRSNIFSYSINKILATLQDIVSDITIIWKKKQCGKTISSSIIKKSYQKVKCFVNWIKNSCWKQTDNWFSR